jgi:ecotin
MKAYPAAKTGMTRWVLNLPKQQDETAFKVELIIGKTLLLDKGNRYFFGGKITRKVIKGWGFYRYIVNKLGPMAGTMMGIDPNTPKVERFITLGGAPYLIRYNSRLPVVVYVPNNVEVRYRIWRAGKQQKMQPSK